MQLWFSTSLYIVHLVSVKITYGLKLEELVHETCQMKAQY